MDWSAEVEKLRIATIAAVDALVPLLKGQSLYAICLQTADDGMSVGLCANTEEGYAEKCSSEAEIEDMTPEYSAYLRWAPAEWRYEIFGDEFFVDINRDLRASSASSNKEFSSYFDHLIEAMADALAYLRAQRAQVLEGVTLFVTISDSDESAAVEQRSVQGLNPPPLAYQFGRPVE